MQASFHLKSHELNEDFLKKLKVMFKSKTITITVEEEMDETEYLLSSNANEKMLRESIAQEAEGELIKVTFGKGAKK